MCVKHALYPSVMPPTPGPFSAEGSSTVPHPAERAELGCCQSQAFLSLPRSQSLSLQALSHYLLFFRVKKMFHFQ